MIDLAESAFDEHDLEKVRGVAIVLWAASPDVPQLCATPFMHAAAAAAMDLEVEVHFTAHSPRLLLPDVAGRLRAGRADDPSIAWFMQQAREHGARFLACPAALSNLHQTEAQCAPWLDGIAGASTVIARLAQPDWRVVVF
jgi:hypothetical protein